MIRNNLCQGNGTILWISFTAKVILWVRHVDAYSTVLALEPHNTTAGRVRWEAWSCSLKKSSGMEAHTWPTSDNWPSARRIYLGNVQQEAVLHMPEPWLQICSSHQSICEGALKVNGILIIKCWDMIAHHVYCSFANTLTWILRYIKPSLCKGNRLPPVWLGPLWCAAGCVLHTRL